MINSWTAGGHVGWNTGLTSGRNLYKENLLQLHPETKNNLIDRWNACKEIKIVRLSEHCPIE